MDWFDEKRDEMLEDDYFIEAQFMARSRQEALDLVGDDSFYPGHDIIEDELDKDEDEEDDDDKFDRDMFSDDSDDWDDRDFDSDDMDDSDF